jgi:guanosine-3',5'-bis(diphosphate) 3'-pyrophosphohydrolase
MEASALAARAHRHQLRKDGQTPYVSHVYRVGLVVRDVFGIDNPDVLVAAILHDTLEDTTTDYDDLAEKFGKDVAGWVAILSKDKRLPEADRELAYTRQLAAAPWQVKICKLADVYDNLMDSPPGQQARTFKNSHRYLDALRDDLPEPARRPWEIVAQLLTDLESRFTGRAGRA